MPNGLLSVLYTPYSVFPSALRLSGTPLTCWQLLSLVGPPSLCSYTSLLSGSGQEISAEPVMNSFALDMSSTHRATALSGRSSSKIDHNSSIHPGSFSLPRLGVMTCHFLRSRANSAQVLIGSPRWVLMLSVQLVLFLPLPLLPSTLPSRITLCTLSCLLRWS